MFILLTLIQNHDVVYLSMDFLNLLFYAWYCNIIYKVLIKMSNILIKINSGGFFIIW